jgi:long-chain fatty acid transport protein
MNKKVLALLLASALPFLSAKQAHASAFALAEQGVSGLGNAYAGAAAVAEDASTVWWNPAGMARLPRGKHVLIGGHLIVPSTKFSNRASSPGALGTGEGGDAGDATLVPNLFFAMDINPRWSFGVGVNVPFGLATEYDENWIGRFQGIKSEVMTLNINPSLSYKLSDRASVGFGLSYQRGEIDLLTGVALGLLGPTPGPETQSTVGLDGEAWGFNIGALFDITPATRVGVHYRSSLEYEMEGSLTVPGAPPTQSSDVKLGLETPANLSLSVAHKISDRVELLGDITWTEWSKVDRLQLIRTSGTSSGLTADTLIFNFEDTWRVAVGANYKSTDRWTLRMGVAFDQSPVPNAEVRSVRLPDSDRYWFSLGATYQMSRSSRFDVGYTFINIKDADINNDQRALNRGLVNGTYKADVNILSVQYQHSF